jgi:hypothetical protein
MDNIIDLGSHCYLCAVKEVSKEISPEHGAMGAIVSCYVHKPEGIVSSLCPMHKNEFGKMFHSFIGMDHESCGKEDG